jgi:hypothetical protein
VTSAVLSPTLLPRTGGTSSLEDGTAVIDRPFSDRLEIVRATPIALRSATPLVLRTGVVSH